VRKTQNDRLRKIRFHTFRHWHATWLYHKTKDIVHVQQRLGHKSITNTLKYIHLSQAYFREENEEYVVKVAKTPEEAMPLIAAGFEEASDFDGVKLYRIPKSRWGG
jgi:integrase